MSTAQLFTRRIAFQFSSVTSSKGIGLLNPALLNNTSRLPAQSLNRANSDRIASRSVTFADKARAAPPAAVISATTMSAAFGSRSRTPTFAPSRAKPLTNARPMPLPAPVTMIPVLSKRPMIHSPAVRYSCVLSAERNLFGSNAVNTINVNVNRCQAGLNTCSH